MAFTVKAFDQIVEDMVAYIISNASQITDLSPGSVIRSYIEGAALSIEEIYVAAYLGFRRYLNDIPSTVFDFTRKSGVKATVDVVFSRVGSSGDVTIPADTRLKTPSGLRFILDAETTILDGNNDSASTSVTAESVGVEYNVGSASVTIIEDIVSGVDTVTNALAATGGITEETDFQYQKRFQAYVEGLGRSNLAGLVFGALSVEGITSATVVENFPPITGATMESGTATTGDVNGQILIDSAATFIASGVKPNQAVVNFTDQSWGIVISVDSEIQLTMSQLDDGSDDEWEIGDAYKVYNKNVNAYLYVDDGSAGGISDSLIATVDSVITGDGTEDNPGYRSAGVNVIVLGPSIITQAVEVSVVPLSGLSSDQIELDITNGLTAYINTLGVGDNIVYNELVKAVMSVYGVIDCDVTVPAVTVSIGSNQVGRLTTVTVAFV